jgi:hypothetical protein
MRPDRFPKVNDVMLAEALRQVFQLAEHRAREINETWATNPIWRAHLILDMWARQERGRKQKLGGPIPPYPDHFPTVRDNPDRPDPGIAIPDECQRPNYRWGALVKKAAP